jgi:hypothetical protein
VRLLAVEARHNGSYRFGAALNVINGEGSASFWSTERHRIAGSAKGGEILDAGGHVSRPVPLLPPGTYLSIIGVRVGTLCDHRMWAGHPLRPGITSAHLPGRCQRRKVS